MPGSEDNLEILDENGDFCRREAIRRLKGLRDGRSLTSLEELIFLRQIQAVFPVAFPPAEPQEQPPSGRMTAIRIQAPKTTS
jgi:hypothetical protein